tara:strand:+ start:355 stop:2169 length:1815 start_codon:yes stop_codon:yes gene_type:complete
MITVINMTLNSFPITTVRGLEDLELNAVFDISPRASINLDSVIFCNTEKSKNSDILRNAHDTLPTEGALFEFEVTDFVNSYTFRFVCDYSNYKILSPSETEVGLFLEESADSLISFRGADINMAFLEDAGYLNSSYYLNFPYIVKNRKTDLEKIQLLALTYTTLKTIYDEIFKIVAIATDISTLIGSPLGIVNLAQSLAFLILNVIQLVKLIEEAIETFIPPLRYHSSISLKTYLTQAFLYLGYSVDFGTWEENPILIPSKTDEIGYKEPITNTLQSGILKPNNYGYNLSEAIDLGLKLCNGEIQIKDSVVHLRPKNDPYWNLESGYVMPDILIEQSILESNGSRKLNREDVYAGKTFTYDVDDSDMWTIQDAADGSNGDRRHTVIVKPITTVDNKRVNLNGYDEVKIPYCLVSKKDLIDELIDKFIPDLLTTFLDIEEIKTTFDEYSTAFSDLAESYPVFDSIGAYELNRDGALRVENHFFTKPKIGVLEETNFGNDRIPDNFNDQIGASAIYNKYYKWDSLVGGVRNPLDLNDTNGKEIFENVEFKFNIKNFSLILDNAYFTTESGKVGRYTAINWKVLSDRVTSNYWVQKNWLINTEEKQV